MIEHIEGLGLDYYVTLVLVEGSIKPSGIISIERKEQFEDAAKKANIYFQEEERGTQEVGVQCEADIRTTTREYVMYAIAREKNNLERLLKATNTQETGIALGYPEEAVINFGNVYNGEKRDETYKKVALARAQQKGVQIPLWLAYIQWIPEQLDIVNRDISPSSERVGRRYQEYIQTTYHWLAKRVEEAFISSLRRLPKKWHLQADGSYSLVY